MASSLEANRVAWEREFGRVDRPTLAEQDDEMLELLQSLRGVCAGALGPYAQVNGEITNKPDIESLPMTRSLPAFDEDGILSMEEHMSLVAAYNAAYDKDQKQMITFLTFANDLVAVWKNHEDLLACMRSLSRSAMRTAIHDSVNAILQYTLSGPTAQADSSLSDDTTSTSQGIFEDFFKVYPKPNAAEVELLSRISGVDEDDDVERWFDKKKERMGTLLLARAVANGGPEVLRKAVSGKMGLTNLVAASKKETE